MVRRFGVRRFCVLKKSAECKNCCSSSISHFIPEDFGRHVRCFARSMRRYQDFKAWQLAHQLNTKVFEMTSTPPAYHDFKFRDNIRDAADSAQRNFPEGFGRFAPGDFAHFLDHSRASLLETKNELGVGLERAYFREADFTEADSLVDRALEALSGLQKYLRSPRAKLNAQRARAQHIARTRKPSNP
jgi:four helix bundle protein